MHEILIVEGDEVVGRSIRGALAGVGFELRMESNGPAGIDAFRDRPAELILLDLNGPGANGFGVCQAIRALEPSEKRCTILMVVARNDVSATLRAFAAGADDYVVAPIDLFELQTRVGRWLGSSAVRDDLIKRRRLVAIQDVVTAISHGVNDPLQVAMMGVELMGGSRRLDPETSRDVSLIRQGLERIAMIMDGLRAAKDRTVPFLGGDRLRDAPVASDQSKE